MYAVLLDLGCRWVSLGGQSKSLILGKQVCFVHVDL
jgi:hypothetical protein